MAGAPEAPAAPSSIHDVALRAGVSTSTVSRALRGLDRVSPATREKVLRAAADLQYVASPTAANLASGRTGIVAVVVPFLQRWFFATLLEGTEERLRENGFHVMLFSVGLRASHRTLMLDQRLLAKRVDAVLVLAADLEQEEVDLLGWLGVPVVTVGVDLGRWDRVCIDDVGASALAVHHLVGLGHERIGYVGGSPDSDVHTATALERRRGLEQALRDAGRPLDPALALECDWTVHGAVAAGRELLMRPAAPTAVLAASDEMAIGVLLAARACGLAVPDELSVIGIDDHELAFTHDLTTVAQPVREQGRVAADLLVEALTGGPRPGRVVRRLPTRLIERGSTSTVPTGHAPQPRHGVEVASA